MKIQTSRALRHHKRRGEWVETLFMARAIALGFRVCRPWGDSARYDFIVERNGRCLRIQVKSSQSFCTGKYLCPNHSSDRHKRYSPRQIDFLAFYVIPLQAWYIIPSRALPKSLGFGVYPHVRRSRGRYEPFREAWPLLTRRTDSRPAERTCASCEAARLARDSN